MITFIKDAITYEGNTWGHAIVSVAFEWGLLVIIGCIGWLLTS